MTLLIMMNSRNVPFSRAHARTPLISPCTEELHAQVKAVLENIGPILVCVCMRVCVAAACLTYHKTCRQWHCCVFPRGTSRERALLNFK